MAKPVRRFDPQCVVVPDQLDLRDRPYLPVVHTPPPSSMEPKLTLPILDQEATNACTGFALASVVHYLLQRHREPPKSPPMSSFMLYSMARRYDEFPGSAKDAGSSLRGAMKGWFKHGVCRFDLWRRPHMPRPAATSEEDWWLDAAQRPLGAYYRVDTRSVTDMHVALHDVGILYASAACHQGWLKGAGATRGQGYWTIPYESGGQELGGHAFVIVGYTPRGFIIQNSWGPRWGTGGRAILTYQDWNANAMDCWVAQLGVATETHREIARSLSLRMAGGRVKLATDDTLRDREISPFVVDMKHNGELSDSGTFRTKRSDVEALVDFHLRQARQAWGTRATAPTDVAIYAHGGLTDEVQAARSAARWVPALYERQIFPIFLMWETDLLTTLGKHLGELVSGLPAKPTGRQVDQLVRFWNQRLERLLAPTGSRIWGEMKDNAAGITKSRKSGGRILYESAMKSRWFTQTPVHLHLIGHSAGAIVQCHIAAALAAEGWKFESINFLAAAATVELFEKTLLPRLRDRAVARLNLFHLHDAAEQQDPTCKPILSYNRSLLYLVSESFEGGRRTPILGMEKYVRARVASLPRIKTWNAPGPASRSTTHGGFDDDPTTMASIIDLIKRPRA
jgi:hypothetical protein